MKKLFLLAVLLLGGMSLAVPTPAETSARVARQFLSTDPIRYKPEGFGGAGHFAAKGYGDDFNVHYSVVSLWVNAIECARKANDFALADELTRHFESFYWENRQACCTLRHVDYNVFGALPAEIFLQNGDRRAYDMAIDFAERQWEKPGPRDPLPDWYASGALPYEERLNWWTLGYTPQTRFWIDDMYMITFLQTQAYRITGEQKYLDRAAKEMLLYLGKIQLANGLFHHSPEAPFAWARGNGWMAAGMTLLLEYLPKDDANRPQILEGYRRMMKTLLAHQRKDGLWGQLVDDPESWAETSGSAMFAYAFQSGVNHGLLEAETYGPAAQKAYAALVARLDAHANISDVCEGTGPKNSRDWYLGRSRVNGDPHGQAPLLWLCNALLDAELKVPTAEVARIDYRVAARPESSPYRVAARPESSPYRAGNGRANTPGSPEVASTNCWLKLRTPKGRKGFPTLVWFHGGGLTGGRPGYIDLKDNGIAQAAVRYRFLSETDADGCIDDAAAAIAWVVRHIAEYGGDPSKVFVAGHSAGGYLTLMAGMDARRLAKYGLKPTDLAGLIPVSGQVSKHFNVRKFAGDADSQYLPKIDALAPLAYCAAASAPTAFIVGDRAIEFPCRVEENEFMVASMRKLGRTDVMFREFPRRDHVTVLGPAHAVIRDFIRTHMGVGSCVSAQPVARIRPHLAGTTQGGNWTIGCEVLDRELAKFSEYADYLLPLGINRIRLQGGWARCEKEKGVYDFSWLDEPVDFCRAHGIEVLLETSYGNPIYEGAGGWDLGAGFPKSEEGLAAWDRWVEAMAKHFKGRVTDWAMWNEPDLKGGKGHVGKTPQEIAAFNVRTAKIIKRVIPDAKISALSLANNSPSLLERCLKGMEGNLDLFDSAIYHGYSPNPDDSYGKVAQQQRVLRKYAPHMSLRQGENGCPSTLSKAYALRDIPWNELSQAKWDLRRMIGDLSHDVACSLFTIIEYTQANRPLNTKGILAAAPDGTVSDVKPAFAAVRNLVSVFDASWTRVRDAQVKLTGKRGVAYAYASPKGRLVAYWDASDRPDETLHHETGELTLLGAPLKDPVLVDLLTGDVYDVTGGFAETLRVPVYDYPWLLAERAALDLAPARTMPHPRVLATADDFARLRADDSGLARLGKDKLIRTADAMLAHPLATYKKEGRRLLAVSRLVLNRTAALGMAYQLTGEKKYAQRAIAEAENAADFPDWNNSHFLDTAEMTLAVALAYDWAYDAMSPASRKKLEQAILTKAFVDDQGRLTRGWWTKAENNWGQVCQGGLLAGAIALQDVYPDVSDRIVCRAVARLPRAMSAYAGDGFPEGPAVYWQYATSYTAVALAALETAYGTDFGLGQAPGLAAQLDYIDGMTGPFGIYFNYADAGIEPGMGDGMARMTDCAPWYLAKRFNRPEALARGEIAAYRAYCEDITPEPAYTQRSYHRLFPLTLLWLPRATPNADDVAPVTAQRFGGAVPIAVLRRGTGPESAYVGLKGGKGGHHHGHLDIGSFVYDAQGVRWTLDLGSENYHQAEQAGLNFWNFANDSDRWRVFRLSSEAHGVLLLDGKPLKADGFADVTVAESAASAMAQIDTTACYDGVLRVTRTLKLAQQGAARLTVSDAIAGARPGTVVRWQQLTNAKIEPQADGSLVLRKKGKTLRVVPTFPVTWQITSVAEPRNAWDTPNPGATCYAFEVPVPADGALNLVVEFL